MQYNDLGQQNTDSEAFNNEPSVNNMNVGLTDNNNRLSEPKLGYLKPRQYNKNTDSEAFNNEPSENNMNAVVTDTQIKLPRLNTKQPEDQNLQYIQLLQDLDILNNTPGEPD